MNCGTTQSSGCHFDTPITLAARTAGQGREGYSTASPAIPSTTVCRQNVGQSEPKNRFLVGPPANIYRRLPISDDDFLPPRPLSIAARQVWDRHAKRIHAEGRWPTIDHDQLCTYAETLELYLRFKRDIDDHGTLVQGRTLQEKVRNPSIMGLASARADLIRLSKVIPLVDPKPDRDGAFVDSYIDEMLA